MYFHKGGATEVKMYEGIVALGIALSCALSMHKFHRKRKKKKESTTDFELEGFHSCRQSLWIMKTLPKTETVNNKLLTIIKTKIKLSV